MDPRTGLGRYRDYRISNDALMMDMIDLFPEQNMSMTAMWGVQRRNIVITCGYSIINKSATVDVGSLMLRYGGGGHHRVGTCQVAVEKAQEAISSILETLNQQGSNF